MRELPYAITTGQPKWETEQWCTKCFGPRWNAIHMKTGRWTCFWQGRNAPKCYIWHFKNEQDAMLFSLVWL